MTDSLKTPSDLLALARECGADTYERSKGAFYGRSLGSYTVVTCTEPQLAEYTRRIRQEERERILAIAKSRYDHEVAGAVHHAGTWDAAYDYHMERQGAMADMLDAISARHRQVAAVSRTTE